MRPPAQSTFRSAESGKISMLECLIRELEWRVEVSVQSYTRIRRLGGGGFGEVWECRGDHDGNSYAIKYSTADGVDDIRRFKREVRLLTQLTHPRLVPVIEANLDSDPICYVMPRYGGSLRDLIDRERVDHQTIRSIFVQILEGMAYAHSIRVIHRDLKPENILVGENCQVVISDFGLG